MRFDVITLFPEIIAPVLVHGVNRRAFEAGPQGGPPAVEVRCWQLRDFADGAYKRVDDRPFGGGPGMVMMAEPLARCLAAVRADRAEPLPAPVVLFSPAGKTINHEGIGQWAASSGAILVCGRYEGVDQRFVDAHVDLQLSLGDFVMSGGEIAAAALLDAVARLQPGVLQDPQSHAQDSFNPAIDGLLDCPHYTRPEAWSDGERVRNVPTVLLSGHHLHMDQWRRQECLVRTAAARPDLIDRARRAGALRPEDEETLVRRTDARL